MANDTKSSGSSLATHEAVKNTHPSQPKQPVWLNNPFYDQEESLSTNYISNQVESISSQQSMPAKGEIVFRASSTKVKPESESLWAKMILEAPDTSKVFTAAKDTLGLMGGSLKDLAVNDIFFKEENKKEPDVKEGREDKQREVILQQHQRQQVSKTAEEILVNAQVRAAKPALDEQNDKFVVALGLSRGVVIIDQQGKISVRHQTEFEEKQAEQAREAEVAATKQQALGRAMGASRQGAVGPRTQGDLDKQGETFGVTKLTG
ncbi:MAG: hypothetical protein Q7S44_01135 [bacterium]|nr:hypothetical protein [bacterium]